MTSVPLAAEAAAARLIGGRYRLLRVIALGGMAAVWEACDEVSGRAVAVKVPSDALARDVRAMERFRREGATAASLAHPRIAKVLDLVDDQGGLAMIMELVRGESLSMRLARERPLAPDEAVRIACESLEALAAAHAAGVVHRDVKPGNILLDDRGGVKVTDFGLARALGEASLTQTGMLLGTPRYLSPEQLRGGPTTPRSDQYSLGVVLYEMLDGDGPFDGDTPASIAVARLAQDPPPLRSRRREISAALEHVVSRALDRRPERRFKDATAMRSALLLAATSRADETRPMIDDRTIPVRRRLAPPAIRGRVALLPAARRRAAALPPAWWLRFVGRILAPAALVAMFAGALAPVVVGASTVRLPSLEGESLAKAREVTRQIGVDLDVRRVDGLPPVDRVVSQTPGGGTEMDHGSTVRVEVSLGNLRRVPSLVGLDLGRARDALARQDLRVGALEFRPTGGAAPGVVLAQAPSSGAIRAGSSVRLVVAEPVPVEDRRRGKREGKGQDD